MVSVVLIVMFVRGHPSVEMGYLYTYGLLNWAPSPIHRVTPEQRVVNSLYTEYTRIIWQIYEKYIDDIQRVYNKEYTASIIQRVYNDYTYIYRHSTTVITNTANDNNE